MLFGRFFSYNVGQQLGKRHSSSWCVRCKSDTMPLMGLGSIDIVVNGQTVGSWTKGTVAEGISSISYEIKQLELKKLLIPICSRQGLNLDL